MKNATRLSQPYHLVSLGRAKLCVEYTHAGRLCQVLFIKRALRGSFLINWVVFIAPFDGSGENFQPVTVDCITMGVSGWLDFNGCLDGVFAFSHSIDQWTAEAGGFDFDFVTGLILPVARAMAQFAGSEEM